MSNAGQGAAAPVWVVIPAAGAGLRMGATTATGKLLHPLAGRTLLLHTVQAFQSHPRVSRVQVVARQEDFAALEALFAPRSAWHKLLPWVAGGTDRQGSVHRGLQALRAAGGIPAEGAAPRPSAGPVPGTPWVLVHDGARPLCSSLLIDRVLEALALHAAVIPALPVHDTVRWVAADAARPRERVVERQRLALCQTPQGFHWPVLWRAHEQARDSGFRGTDDGQLVEQAGEPVHLVPGERRNVKVTLPADLEWAEWLVQHPDWGLGG
ncbi:MAG TPA: 2-C-methyl-D-erythritol 4-phosphate cytidylyltransferase [bacterium]|nr:2-C-methyl-D-erythritol 4-phosphate cytidylyltransferase [bacterium]